MRLTPDQRYAILEDADGQEVLFPVRFEICSGCGGRGEHVHRGIDGNGLTARDFADDPSFADDYWSGVYDVTCDTCSGDRVAPVLDVPTDEHGDVVESRLTGRQQEALDILEGATAADADLEAERRAEARYFGH